jgi:CRP-like cAMP-binding protein
VGSLKIDRDITAGLCRNTIFEGLTQEQIADILPCIVATIKTYGSEECVGDKGEPVHNLGVVLDGALKIYDENPAGRRGVLASIGKNELFGEAVVFATAAGLEHRVIADKGTQVLYLSGDFFLSPCGKDCTRREAHRGIVKNILRLLSDRAIMLGKKVLYLTAPDLKTKIAMYLCELYELSGSRTFHMPLNRDRLAEFFSVARPSLSRELVNLKNQGIIDFRRSNVEILDLDALYGIAGYS